MVVDICSILATAPDFLVHIREVTAYHVQHHIMGQTTFKIFVKTFADSLFKRIVQVEEGFWHSGKGYRVVGRYNAILIDISTHQLLNVKLV